MIKMNLKQCKRIELKMMKIECHRGCVADKSTAADDAIMST